MARPLHATTPKDERPTAAAFAVAAPVIGDKITMLNSPWTFSMEAVRRHYGWPALHLVNDFVANALAVPQLKEDDIVANALSVPHLNDTHGLQVG